MPKKDSRVKEIIDLINDLFGDQSVDQETTLGWMEEIKEAVDVNIDALRDDLKRDRNDPTPNGGGFRRARFMRVLNKKTDSIPPDAIYIGRPTVFGNPFRIGEGKAVHRPMARQEVIDRYRDYFKLRLKTDPSFKAAVDALEGKDLVCWCAPEACHGDVILEYLRSRK